MKSTSTLVVIALLAFALGVAAYALFAGPRVQSPVDNSTVLVEQIRKVSKLVTVEGDVYEIFNRTQTRNVTIYLPLPASMSFDKEASVQVTGKVLVGYDLEQMSVTVDDANKTITLGNLPEPEILAIDHELVYKDLEESWFNSFTVQDYTDLNRAAKESLRKKTLQSKLFAEARVRGNSVIETISFLAAGAGYTVVVEGGAGG